MDKNVIKLSDVLDRLRSVRFQITPEERQLLGITEEDMASFTSEEQLLTSKEIQEAIYEIIQEAYKNVSAFKQLVDQDIAQDPQKLIRSSKVISKFLKHLRSALPPDKASWISGDTFSIAHGIMQDALSGEIKKPAPSVEEKIEIVPMEDADFRLFGVEKEKLTPDTRWEDIKDHVLFFLGKLKDSSSGKTVKNELTKKMPDETKIGYMERFLNYLRDLKIKTRGKLKPFEEKDFGRDLRELKSIVRAIVLPSKKKEVPSKKDDLFEMQQDIVRLLNLYRSIIRIYRDPRIESSFEKMRDLIDSSLPSVALVQDRLEDIQRAVNDLDLTKFQFLTLLDVDTDSLSYNDPSRALLEEYKIRLRDIDKKLEDKPGDKDLETNKKSTVKNIEQLNELRNKDLVPLKDAIDAYLETLKKYKGTLKEKFSEVDLGGDTLFQNFVKLLDRFVLEFNRLFTQQLFKARWGGRSGQLFRKEKGSPEESVSEEESIEKSALRYVEKMAAASSYSDVLERYRGKGIGDVLEKIHDIFSDDEGGLPFLEQKLLSIMEVGPGLDPVRRRELYNKYHGEGLSPEQAVAKIKEESGGNIYNLTGRDYTGNPLGGEGLNLDDMSKVINKLRDLIKKIKVEGKKSEAEEVIKWAADLPKHIKRMAMKKAAFAQHLRRIAYRLLGAEDTDQKKEHYKGVGSEAPYREPGKSGWFIFRERMTKLGKKAMKSFFDRPTFAADVIEAMERAGLNKMLVEGGKVDTKDIDPILEEILKKVTGKSGNLENILGSKAMQEYRHEFDIKKIKKELEESRERLTDLNGKINKTEEEYLPRLEAYAEVLQDPQTAVQKFLQSLKGGEVNKELLPGKTKKKVPTAIKIDRSNYYPTLEGLFKKYITSVKTKTAAAKSEIPTAVLSKYLTEKATLSKLKEKAEKDKHPEDIKKYYHMLNDLSDKVERLFIEDKIELVLEADRETLADIEAFMSTPEAKTETEGVPELARKMVQDLKGTMGKQERAVSELKKMRTGIEEEVKGFKRLYELASSPALEPGKEEMEEAKREYREREKGLSYLMDRSTYKKKMNKIMTYKPGGHKIGWPTDVTEPTLLSPERKKEYEDKVRRMGQDIASFNKKIDYSHKEVLLDRLKSDLAKAEDIVKNYEKTVKVLKDNWRETPFLNLLTLYNELRYSTKKEKSKDNVIRINPEDKKIKNIKEKPLSKEMLQEFMKDMATLEKKAEEAGGIKEIEQREQQINNSEKLDLKQKEEFIEDIKERIKNFEEELKRMKPEYAPDKSISERIKDMKLKMQRMMAQGGPSALKAPTPEQETRELQEKLKGLQEMKTLLESDEYAKSGDPSVRSFLREVEDAIKSTEIGFERLGKKAPVMAKTAADEGKDLSEYEYQLEFGKGLEPAPYMKELKKPRGWEVIDKLFRETKRERGALKEKEEKGLVSNFASPYVKQRIMHLEETLKALDAYRKQLVGIRYKVDQDDREDFVSFEDMVNKFEDMVFEYMDKLKKFKNQRDDAQNRIMYLRESMDHLKEMFDPDTGKFIGLDEKETANLKNIFLRMLYKELEGYWATQIGKNLSVFGDRDTDWYNNVYSTFKHVAQARGNKKALALLNKYKQETRSDFDDIRNRLKSQQLEKEYKTLMEGYQELGIDPKISNRLKDLQTRIETLKKQEKQIDQIFKHMAIASQEALHEQFKESMRKRAEEARYNAGEKAPKEDKELKDVDFDKKIDSSMTEASGKLEAEYREITDAVEESDKIREEMSRMKNEIGTGRVTENKISYDKLHRDYNHRILYGSIMQAKIADLMVLEMSNKFKG